MVAAARSQAWGGAERSRTKSHSFARSLMDPDAVPDTTRVLLLEDDPLDAELFQVLLRNAFPTSFSVEVHAVLKSALARLHSEEFDCVCVDLRLPDAVGTQCVHALTGEAPGLPVVVLTGTDSEDLAIESVRAGAEDYLVKGNVSGTQIGLAIRYACERKRNQLELMSAAHRDSLTGLSNRRHFEERLSHALENLDDARSLSVVLIDLDNFKPVNDTYGHAAGDALLVELARRMTATVRDTDVCARLGGDEFAVLVTQVQGVGEVDEIAERVMNAIRAPFLVGEHTIVPTASVGVATGRNDGCAAAALLAAADLTMYEAKRGGGNKVCFNKSSPLPCATRSIAVENYHLVYQPILSRQGKIVAHEGFLRHAPGDDQEQPASVIVPELTRQGRLGEVTAAIIREVCTTLRSLREAHLETTVAINVASEQVAERRLSQELAETLRANRVDLPEIELEVRIDHRSRHQLNLLEGLTRLERAGFNLVLDDFSEEHLFLLRNLRVAGVKLSPQFQADGLKTARSRSYLAAVVNMCHGLGVWVGATRIESAVHLRPLFDAGCDRFQGFYLGAPGSRPSERPERPIRGLEMA